MSRSAGPVTGKPPRHGLRDSKVPNQGPELAFRQPISVTKAKPRGNAGMLSLT